jgi:uncharacterized membrane protein YdcZ (DUF606 family)
MKFDKTSIKVWGFEYPDPLTHDSQHWWASMVGMIAGVTIFVTYYFFTRVESEAAQRQRQGLSIYPWKMPWYYFVVGILLSAFSMSSIACVLSTAIRPREIILKKH